MMSVPLPIAKKLSEYHYTLGELLARFGNLYEGAGSPLIIKKGADVYPLLISNVGRCKVGRLEKCVDDWVTTNRLLVYKQISEFSKDDVGFDPLLLILLEQKVDSDIEGQSVAGFFVYNNSLNVKFELSPNDHMAETLKEITGIKTAEDENEVWKKMKAKSVAGKMKKIEEPAWKNALEKFTRLYNDVLKKDSAASSKDIFDAYEKYSELSNKEKK